MKLFSKKKLKSNYIKLFFKLNSHFDNYFSVKSIYVFQYIQFYRFNFFFFNLLVKFQNLKNLFLFFKNIVFLNCRIFFISTNTDIARFIFYYSKKINQYCFIGDWVSGLLTNFSQRFSNIFLNIDSMTKIKGSLLKRNKFFLRDRDTDIEIKLFKNRNKKVISKKFDLVFFIASQNIIIDLKVIKEIFLLGLPLIGFFNAKGFIQYSSYFFLTNTNKYFNVYFFFLLLIKYYLYLKSVYFEKELKNINLLYKQRLKLNFFKLKKLKHLKKC